MARKSRLIITCSRCLEDKRREEFQRNPKLVDGVLPWCEDCMELLKAGELPRENYETDYQRAYQGIYQKDRGRIVGRNITKRVLQMKLPKKLTLEIMMEPETRQDVVRLLPRILTTQAWKKFEEEIIAKADIAGAQVLWYLSPVLYPEFLALEGNCYAGVAGTVGDDDVDGSGSFIFRSEAGVEGLRVLADCLSEV